ncbi:MAG TPA: phage major capsid protein [Cyclobacteriaceae bacterium]
MKQELKDLFDKKGKIVNEMTDALRLVKERKSGEYAGVMNPEERTKFTSWDNDLNKVQEQIDLLEREEKLNLMSQAHAGVKHESDQNKEKKFNETATSAEKRNAIDKAKVRGYSALTDEERSIVDTDLRDQRSFEKFLKFGFGKLGTEDREIITRAQSTTTTAGGYTIPEGFAGRIVESMVLVSQLLSWCNIIRTDSGNLIPFPTNDDNSNTGELIGENQDLSSSSADLVFGVKNLTAYKMSSKMVKVSNELAQDNGVDLIGYLAKRLGIRLGKISNSYYTTGTGSSQPTGYLAASGGATRGKVTSSTSTFTLAELAEFQDSIDPAYRLSPKKAFAMHSNILAEIKGLALASDKPGSVWAPSYRDGDPDRILGAPYFFNQAMSSTSATGDKIIAYGDWSKFNVRIVNGADMLVLRERYAELGQVAYCSIQRTDSFLEDTAAVKYMDIS